MSDPNNPLAQLKDIHLPEAIGAWPLAPGYWLAIILAAVLLMSGIYLCLSYKNKNRYRSYALAQLETLQQESPKPSADILLALNQTLKRTALAAYPKHDIAALYGQDWVAFLTETAAPQSGYPHLERMTELLYRSLDASEENESSVIDHEFISALVDESCHWVRRHQC